MPANVDLRFHFSDLLSEAIDSLGGYYSDIFTDHDDDVAHILADVHNKVGDDNLNIETAQKKLGCLKINKVEELVVNDDPEYKWIDKIRTPRASNEARQLLFSKASGLVSLETIFTVALLCSSLENSDGRLD